MTNKRKEVLLEYKGIMVYRNRFGHIVLAERTKDVAVRHPKFSSIEELVDTLTGLLKEVKEG